MESTTKDWIQVITWLIGAFGVVSTAILGVIAAFRAIRTREEELRWKKSNLAQQLLLRLESDQTVKTVFEMMDLTSDIVDIGNGPEKITKDDIVQSFLAGDGKFKDKDIPIRKCFDSLFTHLEHIQHNINERNILPNDVKYFFPYHIKNLLNITDEKEIALVPQYLAHYDFHLAKQFIDSFDITEEGLIVT